MSVIIRVDNMSVSGSRCRINRNLLQYAWPAVAVLCVIAFTVLLRGFSGNSAELTLLTSPSGQNSSSPSIKTGAIRVERMHGYVTVTGMVTNLTQGTLKNVEAFVEFFDKRGDLIRSESALIELPMLQAKEESPYSIQARDMPDAASYRVRFRELLGASIPSTVN